MGRRRTLRAVAMIFFGLVAAVSGSPIAGTAAGRTPSWTGHWAMVLTCPYPNCSNGTGTLDLVQSGNRITGTATAEGGGITLSTGTASGLTATLDFVSSAYSIKLNMTMSANGASLTGQWIVTEKSTGISRTLGVTGTRSGGPSVKASVSASPAKTTVSRVKQTSSGETDKVTVTVTFSNPSKASAANLQLLSLTVVPVDRTTAPPKLGFPSSSFPVHLGTLAPGAVLSKSFALDVERGNGLYKVEVLALFDDPTVQGGNGRAFASGGQFQVNQQLAIEGTVVAAPSCASPSCKAKPLAGVTVTANGPKGGQVRTGFDGKYSIEVSKGDYTVTATYRNKSFQPPSRSVTVDGSTISGVDFTCATTQKAGVTTACEVPALQAAFEKNTDRSINFLFQGKGWDPNGGPIHLSFSGNSLPDLPAKANFDGSFEVNRWPKRISIFQAAKGSLPNGYCWGDLAARQGTSFASSHVQGKWAGWVLWSADARIRSGEAWCDGEDNSIFHKSPAPIIAWGYFDHFKFGVFVFNQSKPGEFIGPLGSNYAQNIYIPGHNVCVRLSETGASSAVPHVRTTPGRCT